MIIEHCQPHPCVSLPATMSLEASRNFFIPEPLRASKEKLRLVWNRLREYYYPPALSATSLETEVSTLGSAHLSHRGGEISHAYRNPPD